jgi:ATP synthase protein I
MAFVGAGCGVPPAWGLAMAEPPKKRPFGRPPAILSRNNLRRLELASMGLYLLVAIALGVAIGYYLDRWLHTAPWFLVIFLTAGVFAGFRNMYRLLRREIDLSRDKDASK